MKKIYLFIVMSLFIIPLFAQEPELGLPGDNLNLYGVLNIFRKSQTLEEFEKTLNAEDSKVNNLDLNGDGSTDYIHVSDHANGSAHAIVLQVDIKENESQDIAVIEVEKDVNNQLHVQIVGDELLYGKDYIVEPNQNTANPGYEGNVTENSTDNSPSEWSIISYMFTPSYVMYVSPYHWDYYPNYWNSWSPIGYNVYFEFHRSYYEFYRRSYIYHSPAAHAYYVPLRASSGMVRGMFHSPNIYRSRHNRPESPFTHMSPHNRFESRNHFESPRAQRSERIHNESPRMHRSLRTRAESPRIQRSHRNYTESPRMHRSLRTRSEYPRTQRSERIHNESPRIQRSQRNYNESPRMQRSMRTRTESPRIQRSLRNYNESPRIQRSERVRTESPRIYQSPRSTYHPSTKTYSTPSNHSTLRNRR